MAAASFLRKGFPVLTRAAENPYAANGKWLLGVGGMVIGMIHVGGVTRLTGSGLSMTTWSATGSLPPLSLSDWQVEFDRYKTFPEWQQRKSMSLSDFQYIYWWEYGHRMLGRVVGVAFCVPWLYFTARGRIPSGYQPRMALLATMGAGQGAIGWWMVKSGLGDDRRGDKNEIRVQPVRLATHLSMALATYGVLLWSGLDMLKLPHKNLSEEQMASCGKAIRHASRIRAAGMAVTGLTAVTVVSGALVAGNDAGRAFNTFPTMDGQWIPDAVLHFDPKNLIKDTAVTQWNHRVLGTVTAVSALALAVSGKSRLLTPQARQGLTAVGLAATAQWTLGVTTLLNYVPIHLAAMHQIGSVVVFTSGLYLVHALRYARPSLIRTLPKAIPPVALPKSV